MTVLSAKGLSIFRGSLCVADGIDFTLRAGRIYAVLGPNGAGKSSLLKALFAELPYRGEIRMGDTLLQRAQYMSWRKKIGYMPQDTHIDASLSALEVVLLGQMDRLGMRVSDEQLALAVATMDTLGIAHLAQRDVLDLSGGQRQMVMFAQVLLRNPQVLLLDEPVSALDMHHQCVLLDQVREYTRERGLITLMILHDLNLAAQFADELILLADAAIQAQGCPKTVLQRGIIERLYRVQTTLLHDENGRPMIMPRRAIRN